MSPRSSAPPALKVDSSPNTSRNAFYAYWQPGSVFYSLSAPACALPYGYPPPPSLTPGHPPAASMSAFPAAPGPYTSIEYTATPCPDCGQVIKVSSATTYHMDRHRESQRCKRQAARKVMKDEEAKASALRTELFSNTPGARGQAGESVSAPIASDGGKGKAREDDSSKKFCDIGVQANAMPDFPVVQMQRKRRAHRRFQSEPLPDTLVLEERSSTPAGSCFNIITQNENKVEKDRESVDCLQCGETLLKRNIRNHVGSHILRQLVGAPEGPNMKYAVHPGNPCGFCGRAGCEINLVKANSPASKYTAATSNCPHAHSFSLNKARRFSSVMPCTNVPVPCTLCPKDPHTKARPVFWKYNMFHHIQAAHPAHWDWHAHRVRGVGVNFRKLLAVSEKELDAVAPVRTRPYPGPVGDAVDDEDEPVISNKRAAVEALLGSANGGSPKRLKES